MNKKIFLVSISITLIFSIFVFFLYKTRDNKEKELYVMQIGAYKNYDNVIKNTKVLDNYIVYQEDGLNKILIGVTASNQVYQKIKTTYAPNDDTLKKTLKTKDLDLTEKIETYDKLLLNTEDKETMNKIIKEELRLLNIVLN